MADMSLSRIESAMPGLFAGSGAASERLVGETPIKSPLKSLQGNSGIANVEGNPISYFDPEPALQNSVDGGVFDLARLHPNA